MLGFFHNLRIRTKLLLMTGLVFVTTASLGGMFWSAFGTARVNGPMYVEIVKGKDLVADILPPPEYIIETYLDLHLLLAETDPAERSRFVEKLAALQHDFNDRLEHWQAELPEGEIKQCLVQEVAPPAKEFYDLLNASFLPMVRSQRISDAKGLVAAKLKPLYETHRKAVNKLADTVNRANDDREKKANDYVTGCAWRMSASGALASC